jgi:hypothetical protein
VSEFDPFRVVRALLARDVKFVIVGGFAGRAWGSPAITNDLDICYERSKPNLDALAATLRELGASLRGAPEGLPFQLDGKTLAMGDSFTFETAAGWVDCLGTPSGTTGYHDLIRNAADVTVDDVTFKVVSLDDLLRMKRAAGRPKDRVAIEILSALKEERERAGVAENL